VAAMSSVWTCPRALNVILKTGKEKRNSVLGIFSVILVPCERERETERERARARGDTHTHTSS